MALVSTKPACVIVTVVDNSGRRLPSKGALYRIHGAECYFTCGNEWTSLDPKIFNQAFLFDIFAIWDQNVTCFRRSIYQGRLALAMMQFSPFYADVQRVYLDVWIGKPQWTTPFYFHGEILAKNETLIACIDPDLRATLFEMSCDNGDCMQAVIFDAEDNTMHPENWMHVERSLAAVSRFPHTVTILLKPHVHANIDFTVDREGPCEAPMSIVLDCTSKTWIKFTRRNNKVVYQGKL